MCFEDKVTFLGAGKTHISKYNKQALLNWSPSWQTHKDLFKEEVKPEQSISYNFSLEVYEGNSQVSEVTQKSEITPFDGYGSIHLLGPSS